MNWEQFLTDNNIDFVKSGPNVKKGNINIACPFCGDDPSHHLGINPKNNKWGCWRDASHVGRKPEHLIRALIGCSYQHAKLIVDQGSFSDPDTFDGALQLLTATGEPANKPERQTKSKLVLPRQFKDIKKKGSTRKYYDYIKSRGFKNNTLSFIGTYSLKACTSGDWRNRIIFPIYQDYKLVSWTSRALQNPVKMPRYMTLSEDDGALINIKEILYNIDSILDDPKDILFLTEGPIDALKIDYFGYDFNVRATCTFSTNVSLSQIQLISELVGLYKKVILLFDQNTLSQKMELMDYLGRYGVIDYDLDENIEDPGSMTRKQVKRLIKSVQSL